jgi:long-subunit fatty acid transport protein
MIIARDYEDTWSWAIGLEYQVNNNWVARVGYEPRTSSIPDNATDLLFPLGEMDLYTAGLGWQFDRVTHVDAAIAYLHSETSTPTCESQNANSCIEGNVVYNPYFATPFENEVNGVLVALSIDRKF